MKGIIITSVVAIFIMIVVFGYQNQIHQRNIVSIIAQVQHETRIMEQKKPWLRQTASKISDLFGRWGRVER